MALSDEQLLDLGNDILVNPDPIVQAALTAGDHNAIADWYNLPAAPDFWVLVDSLRREFVIAAMDWDNEYATGFKDDIPALDFLFAMDEYDPRSVNSRQALNTVFAGAPNSKAQILDIAVRLANSTEQLFAIATSGPGGGDGSAKQQAAIAEFSGTISATDVTNSLALATA